MKAVAQRDDKTRRIALDQARQPRQRRRRIVRRQQHAALGEGRAFFQMQIGDDEQSFVRPVQRAGRIGDEHRTGESDSGILLWIPACAGMSGRSATPHCIASFTNSVRRFGEERIGRLAVNRLAPDLQHDRHGERRHMVERFMDDSPPDAREHIGEAAHVEEAGRGVGAGGAQQHVIGLVAAQHVIDQVGRDRDLAPGFLLTGKTALDQAGDDRAIAEGALHQRRFGEPSFEVVAQHVLIEQVGEREFAARDAQRHVAEAPDRQRVFIGDKAERPQPRSFEPPRQQHAERLMRQPAFERIADEIVLVGARKRFDQELAGAGHLRTPFLDFEPFAHLRRQFPPFLRMGDDVAHAGGEISRERKFAAVIGRHLGVFGGRARDIDLVLDQGLVFEDFPGEHESVARHHGLDEIFLDLAEEPAAARNHLRRPRAHEANLQHVGLDDGADIEPVTLRHIGVRDAPAAVLALPDAGEALVGLERVAAGGDEIDHGIEIRPRQADIGRGGRHLGIKLIAEERLAASAAEHVLRQYVERADAKRRRVLRILGNGVERGAAFEHFEAVRRNKHALRRLVHAVIGAADALQEPRGALRRADIDDQIDVAPVDAEIERGGADHRAQAPGRHRAFDLAPLRHVERTVVQRDGEIVVVDVPELLKNTLRLAARVDEDERGAVRSVMSR